MDTVNGNIRLDHTSTITILDFHTGLRKKITIVNSGNQKCLNFIIKNELYYLGYDWKIKQPKNIDPRGFIVVGEIFEKKLEYIYDKFNRKHYLQGVVLNNGNLARPEGFSEQEWWYDKQLVVSL